MRITITASEWRAERLKNYQTKLQLSRAQALKRLMIFDTKGIQKEFDKICDADYRSNHEPGLSFEARKLRTKEIYNPSSEKKPTQLSLF